MVTQSSHNFPSFHNHLVGYMKGMAGFQFSPAPALRILYKMASDVRTLLDQILAVSCITSVPICLRRVIVNQNAYTRTLRQPVVFTTARPPNCRSFRQRGLAVKEIPTLTKK